MAVDYSTPNWNDTDVSYRSVLFAIFSMAILCVLGFKYLPCLKSLRQKLSKCAFVKKWYGYQEMDDDSAVEMSPIVLRNNMFNVENTDEETPLTLCESV